MKPAERLELLHEVAGTRVYDERREESVKIMDDTSGKREKIDEVLSFLDERLEELEKEKEELKDYQEQDRNRRVLEYTIYTKEMADVNKKLEELEGRLLFVKTHLIRGSFEGHPRNGEASQRSS